MTDNVRVQQRLLAEVFGVERVKLVYGFSMGGAAGVSLGRAVPGPGREDRADLRLGQVARRTISCFSKGSRRR